jgi:hypothetical protein
MTKKVSAKKSKKVREEQIEALLHVAKETLDAAYAAFEDLEEAMNNW